jgi:hypothetical protein
MGDGRREREEGRLEMGGGRRKTEDRSEKGNNRYKTILTRQLTIFKTIQNFSFGASDSKLRSQDLKLKSP